MKKVWLKKILLPGCIVALCAFLSGCGQGKLSQSQMKETLPDEAKSIMVGEEQILLEIQGFNIERQQTQEKREVVYVNVELGNDTYHCIRPLKLDYAYYDKGGWYLEGYGLYEEEQCECIAAPFSEEKVLEVLREKEYDASKLNYKSVNMDTTAKTAGYVFGYTSEDVNLTISGDLTVLYTFAEQDPGMGYSYETKKYYWNVQVNDDGIRYDWHFLGKYHVDYEHDPNFSKAIDTVDVEFISYDGENVQLRAVTPNRITGENVYEDASIDEVRFEPKEGLWKGYDYSKPCLTIKTQGTEAWIGAGPTFYIYPDRVATSGVSSINFFNSEYVMENMS